MHKILACLFLFFCTIGESHANFVFNITYCADETTCSTELNISENGDINIISSNPVNSDHATIVNNVRSSLQGIQLYNESISSAQEQIINRIGTRINLNENAIKVTFNHRSLSNNDFIQMQQKKLHEFEQQLFSDISQPVFRGEYVTSNISFDTDDPSDVKALKTYYESNMRKYQQLGENDKYREADFSAKLIEIRQNNKGVIDTVELNQFTTISQAIINNNSTSILTAFKALYASNEFQTGFASSLANNFNPASFIYPIEVDCDSDWCRAGQAIGDISSLLIGGYEFLSGISLTAGSTSLTLTASIATGGLATPVVLPATAGATLAGIALAGHGLTVIENSFTRLYSKIESPDNISNTNKSQKLLNKISKTKLKKIKKTGKKFAIDLKKSHSRYGDSVLELLANDSIISSLKKWGKLDNGKHQLFEHTLKRLPPGLTSLEKRAGLKAGALSGATSNDTKTIANSIKSMDKLADSVINSSLSIKTVSGFKEIFWAPGKAKLSEGIRVIRFKGKIQSVHPRKRMNWNID